MEVGRDGQIVAGAAGLPAQLRELEPAGAGAGLFHRDLAAAHGDGVGPDPGVLGQAVEHGLHPPARRRAQGLEIDLLALEAGQPVVGAAGQFQDVDPVLQKGDEGQEQAAHAQRVEAAVHAAGVALEQFAIVRGPRVFVERIDDLSFRIDALGDAERQRPWDVRLGVVFAPVVGIILDTLADGQDITVPLRADQGGLGHCPLDNGVRRDRRPMDQAISISEQSLDASPVRVSGLLDGVEHGGVLHL